MDKKGKGLEEYEPDNKPKGGAPLVFEPAGASKVDKK